MTILITYELGGLGVLVIALILARRYARKKKSDGARENVDSSATVPEDVTEFPDVQVTANESKEISEETGHSAQPANVEVTEVDILDEVDIYLTYGMLDQAATSLAWYLQANPDDTVRRDQLRDLYIETEKYDLLTEMLETDLAIGAIGLDKARAIVLAAIEHQPTNLALRVFADQFLGLPPETLVSIPEVEAKEELASAERPALEIGGYGDSLRAFPRSEGVQIGGNTPTKTPGGNAATSEHSEEAYRLLSGTLPLARLSEDEQRIVNTLVSPKHLLELLNKSGQVDEEIHFLTEQINKLPEDLRYHTLLLERLFSLRDKSGYGLALLHLFTVLQGRGADLRRRLLDKGKLLGESPLWDALMTAGDDLSKIRSLAEQYGFVVEDIFESEAPSLLVSERREQNKDTPEVSVDDPIMHEYDMFIEYGQVSEAMDLLENAMLESKEPQKYFGMLLELYERVGDVQRIARFKRRMVETQGGADDGLIHTLSAMMGRMQPQGLGLESD
ncbi:MAG: hypothetical protein JJ714_07140 [Acidithiobacillus sp.]|nr:hypothetical protein [Acidithiobacillus sp.]